MRYRWQEKSHKGQWPSGAPVARKSVLLANKFNMLANAVSHFHRSSVRSIFSASYKHNNMG